MAFKKQAQLVLGRSGLGMAVRIPDLRVDDQGMSCTLSFSREPFFCVVPWASVFALVGNNGQGMVWPDDMPAEVQKESRTVENARAAWSRKARSLMAREPKAEGPKPKRPRKLSRLLAAVADAGPQDAGAKPVKAVRRAAADRPSRPGQGIAPRPAVTPAPPLRPSQGGARKKRKELPPYLRVVK